jgi:regulator of protease activity HflC (stomatin/prohibitin superfamily)
MRRIRQSGQGLAVYGCGAAALLGVIVIIAVLFSGANVQPGHVGVVGDLGGINPNQQPLPQGFHPVMPFVTHIESVSVQPQNHTFKEVGAASKELQNVFVDGGVNYHVDANTAAKLVIAGGVDAIVSKVFDPAFQDYIKTVVPTYAVEEILPNRDAIRATVKQKLADKALPYGIFVDDVFLTNIHFDPAYTAAIEAKQVASQKLEQAKIEAQTAVAQATGQSQANAILTQSLTTNLILWNEIQKWNGILPTVVGTGGVFATIGAPAAK